MQFDIRYLPTVTPGCYMDCGLFWEQHEWLFIINAIGTTSCMDVVYVNRFFFAFCLLVAVKYWNVLVVFVLPLHLVSTS